MLPEGLVVEGASGSGGRTVETLPSSSSDNVNMEVPEGGLVTKAMIEEEEKLHQATLEEEEKIREKTEKEILESDGEDRYSKLQYLLSKSTMYTNYLIQRMKRQQAEDEKKLERRKKKLAKEAEKKKLEAQNVKQEAKENCGEVKEETRDEEKSVQVPSSTRRSARATSSQESSTAEGANTKKRKVDIRSPKTTDSLQSKRKKTKTVPAEDEEEEITAPPDDTNDTDEPSLEELEQRRLEDDLAGIVRTPPLFSGGDLRNYQLDGFAWLKTLYENGVNGILADEMGLGKTIQCIALVAYLIERNVPGPFLVVGPLSTVPNWVSEFMRFTPKIPVLMYHGSKEQRACLRAKISKPHQVTKRFQSHPVVVTSYEIVMRDRKHIMNHAWKMLIVDEGHRIKNCQCRLVRELKLYQSTHRLLLTGTPLQNNLSELWSLLNFLLPEIFDDLGSFEMWFDLQALDGDDGHRTIVQEEQRKNVLGMLHQILSPFVLRRMKTDVALAIPPKREILVYAPMSQKQRDIYKSVLDKTVRSLLKVEEVETAPELDKKGRPLRRSRNAVDYAAMLDEDAPKKTPRKGKRRAADVQDDDDDDLEDWVKIITEQNRLRESGNRPQKMAGPSDFIVNVQLRNTMAMLRKCCNHPYLIEYPLVGEQFRVDEDLPRISGKLRLLDCMLTRLKREGHKVLLFSQMTQMLDILQDYCYLRQLNYCRLDGSTGLEQRREQIDSFNQDPDVFMFLLSTRAGGLGINLIAADTVVIFDSDWNPQCDLQAQDRCHRIGQTRPVLVYRLVTAGTIDQKIVERAASKRKLEKLVIHKDQFKRGLDMRKPLQPKPLSVLDPNELLQLLKETDFDSVVEGQDRDVISDHDLERLLDRSDLVRKWKARTSGKPGSCPVETTEAPSDDAPRLFKVIDEDTGDSGFESCSTDAKDAVL